MRLLRWGIVLVLLAAYLLTGVVQIRPGELAVVRRFGRLLPDRPGPGLWIGLPWGMDRVDRVAVDRLQSVTVGYQGDEDAEWSMPAGQLLSGDHNLVNVQVTVFYKVRAGEVEEYVLQKERAEGLLARAVETVLSEWVGSHTVDDVLLNGKNTLRPVLSARTQERVEPYRLGVQVLDARVVLLAPPKEVKDAFDSVALEQTRNEERRNQAEQEVERDLRLAEAARYQTEQETAAYVRNTKLLARRDAERFLERLRQYQVGRQGNPNYLRQIWEEERGKLFEKLKQNRQIDLLDHHLGANGLDLITAPPLPQKP